MNFRKLKVESDASHLAVRRTSKIPLNAPVMQAKEFLQQVYSLERTSYKGYPIVTVSYAQSLDGYISKPGRQVRLSCEESMKMTHQLRAMNDCVLVGIETVLVDNPQLNVRLVDCEKQPRPVVLDSRLRLPLNAKLRNFNPLVFSSIDSEWSVKVDEWAGIGLDLKQVLRHLKHLGYERVMVEGGAKVLSSFFEQGLVDYVIVTVCPVYLCDGVRIKYPSSRVQGTTQVFGVDCVIGGRLQ